MKLKSNAMLLDYLDTFFFRILSMVIASVVALINFEDEHLNNTNISAYYQLS